MEKIFDMFRRRLIDDRGLSLGHADQIDIEQEFDLSNGELLAVLGSEPMEVVERAGIGREQTDIAVEHSNRYDSKVSWDHFEWPM